MGDFSDFQRGQIVGAHLPGTSVTKTGALLCVSKAAQIMSGHHHLRGILVENQN